MDKNFESEDAELRQELFNSLVEYRKQSTMTQVQVAALMGVGQPTVSEFESGKVAPRLSTLQKYARALGLKIEFTIQEGSEYSASNVSGERSIDSEGSLLGVVYPPR